MYEILGSAGRDYVERIASISPTLAHSVTTWAVGEVWQDGTLEVGERRLVTLAVACSVGSRVALDIHIRAALVDGFTPGRVAGVFAHAAVYCGLPKALDACVQLLEILDEDQPHLPSEA